MALPSEVSGVSAIPARIGFRSTYTLHANTADSSGSRWHWNRPSQKRPVQQASPFAPGNRLRQTSHQPGNVRQPLPTFLDAPPSAIRESTVPFRGTFSGPDEAGHCRARSLYPRYEQQGALGALLQSSGASSTVDGTLGRTGIAQSVRDLDEAYCKEPNRLVRTRMLGGVGGAPEQSGPLSRSIVRPLNLLLELCKKLGSTSYVVRGISPNSNDSNSSTNFSPSTNSIGGTPSRTASFSASEENEPVVKIIPLSARSGRRRGSLLPQRSQRRLHIACTGKEL